MTSLIARLAAGSDARVFAIAGAGSRAAVQDLRLADGVELVDSPRAADVLLVAGALDPRHHDAVRRVHDALPHPRASVRWAGSRDVLVPGAAHVALGTDPSSAIRAAHQALMHGTLPTEPPLLPDEDPAPWRGVGPYGQGGSGMTGGTPYGRPMAELAPDRDGLRLDLLPTRLGPFSSLLPHGLELDLRVSGDILVGVEVAATGLAASATSASLFIRALTEPVSIAELEIGRARDHLRWTADALRLQGLRALSLRALRLGLHAAPGDHRAVERLAADIARTGIYRWSLPAADGARTELLAGARLGPSTRASGVGEDERQADPAYRSLGFAPLLGAGGGAAAAWRLRLAEAVRSLELAGRGGDTRSAVTGAVESPRGRLALGDAPSGRALGLLPTLIEGMEWGDAMATIAALDIDLDELGAVTAGTSAEAAA